MNKCSRNIFITLIYSFKCKWIYWQTVHSSRINQMH